MKRTRSFAKLDQQVNNDTNGGNNNTKIRPLCPVVIGDVACEMVWNSGGTFQQHMRWTLFNWLLDLASPDVLDIPDYALYIAFSLIDRYLYVTNVVRNPNLEPDTEDLQPETKENLSLIGITCLFLSAKIFTRHRPGCEEYASYMDRQYSVDDILVKEIDVLNALNFVIFKSLSCETSSLQNNMNQPLQGQQTLFSVDTSDAIYHTYKYILDVVLVDQQYTISSYEYDVIHLSAKLISQIVIFGSSSTVPDDSVVDMEMEDVTSKMLVALHQEKVRLERGKRSAAQRRHSLVDHGQCCQRVMLNLGRIKNVLQRYFTTLSSTKNTFCIATTTSTSRSSNSDDYTPTTNNNDIVNRYEWEQSTGGRKKKRKVKFISGNKKNNPSSDKKDNNNNLIKQRKRKNFNDNCNILGKGERRK